MCTYTVEGCVYSASQQVDNNQSIDVFQIFHLSSVEMYGIFITQQWLLDIRLDLFSTVSEHKKLTMIAVCILIDIVHATPYDYTSSFHI